ncbi:MAG: biopolymer transporter ExbD [Verrucomicrobia bacterium]|nr:biopolymer transporter ExbD [Verrucomicrobiota bacterium]
MSLIPDEEFKRSSSINLAPMVDFLFLVIAVFATMAITRAALYDTEVNLVKVTPEKQASPAASETPALVNISITEDGKYKWLTEVNEFIMENPASIKKELLKQQQLGLIPSDAHQTKVLLHIDKNARWEPVAQVIFTIREAGFSIHPVYEPEENRQ